MSYLTEFGKKFDELMIGVDETVRKTAVKFAKKAVLESYRNGQKAPVSENKKSSK